MRILVLTDKLLSRKLGDGLRVYGLLRPLVGRYRFDLVAFARQGESLEPDIAALFESTTLVPAPQPRRSSLPRRLYKALSGEDFKPSSAQMRQTIMRSVQSRQPDLILEIAANALPNLPPDLDIPIVVDAIDEPLLRELRAARIGPLAGRASHLYRAWRFWRYERSEQRRAALSIYVSSLDADTYRKFFPRRAVAVVPNGVDTEFFRPMVGGVPTSMVVFEGNMNFHANVDAAQRLVREILPLVQQRIPTARAVLVGRDPSPEASQLAGSAVEVTGTVPDIRPYLARASVFACPMRLGSGIKNKILQAWAMGMPVIATPESLGGLSARDGENILVRDDVRAFAKAVCDVMTDPALAMRLGAAGRATVESEYSWQRQAENFAARLQAVAHARRVGADSAIAPLHGVGSDAS